MNPRIPFFPPVSKEIFFDGPLHRICCKVFVIGLFILYYLLGSIFDAISRFGPLHCTIGWIALPPARGCDTPVDT